MISGYKCFDKGLKTHYGDELEVGKVYHVKDNIRFQQSGFHMCQNLEDTLRYFDAFNDEVVVASVTGFGKINEYEDDYNGFYNMYAVEYLLINRILSHEEIIDYALHLPPYRVKRFISLFKLMPDEIKLFQEKYANESDVLNTIDYYQNGISDSYHKQK